MTLTLRHDSCLEQDLPLSCLLSLTEALISQSVFQSIVTLGYDVSSVKIMMAPGSMKNRGTWVNPSADSPLKLIDRVQ